MRLVLPLAELGDGGLGLRKRLDLALVRLVGGGEGLLQPLVLLGGSR